MDKVLIQQNPHWQSQTHSYDNFIPRGSWDDIARMLQLEEILILQGIRRCGKSTAFMQIINVLMQNNDAGTILYINFDDPYYSELLDDSRNIYKIVENAEKITRHKIQFLLLDEAQNVTEWEKFVKSTYDSKVFKKICITGSNSKLLSGNYAYLLTGRYVRKHLNPLSFQEAASVLGLKDNITMIKEKSKLLRLLEDSLFFGLFPKIFLENNEKSKRDILQAYFESIIQKDCIYTNEIRDVKTFKALTNYLLSNIASCYSYASLAKVLACSDITVKEFINILEQSYLLHEVKHFSFSLKKQSKAHKKCYFVDNGIIWTTTMQFFDRKGPLFENFIFNELKKMDFKNIYYFDDGRECDFIISDNMRHIAIQVTSELNDNNRKREIAGLNNAMEKCRCSKGFIITVDQDEEISDDITVIPFWRLFTIDKKLLACN